MSQNVKDLRRIAYDNLSYGEIMKLLTMANIREWTRMNEARLGNKELKKLGDICRRIGKISPKKTKFIKTIARRAIATMENDPEDIIRIRELKLENLQIID